MEFVVQVVQISTICFSKWTNNTNVCKCLTGGIQGLKAKCAGNLRFLVGRLATYSFAAIMQNSFYATLYSHNANCIGL